MNTQIIDAVQADQVKNRPEIKIGDTVKLSLRITEGEKSRIQIFEGIVISMTGYGLDAMITVRKISSGVGVERIVPLHSPILEDVTITKRGKVRRSKLYYMRDRVGKRAMKIKGTQQVNIVAEKPAVVEEVVEPVAEEAPEVEAAAPVEEAKK